MSSSENVVVTHTRVRLSDARCLSLKVRAVPSRRRFLLGVLASVIWRLPITRRAVVIVHFSEGKTSQFVLLAARALSRRPY